LCFFLGAVPDAEASFAVMSFSSVSDNKWTFYHTHAPPYRRQKR
jgi:hypothetical protein